MHDQNGVGLGVSQVATACHLLWPLNEELCKLLFTDSSSSLSLCPWDVLWWAWERHLALGALPDPACPWDVYSPSGLWGLVSGSVSWPLHKPGPPAAGQP